MEFINATRMIAGYTMGIEPRGRELLVVVIKGTFHLPRTPDEPLRLHEEQLPLIMADTFTGEPGFSAPHYEVDFAPRKRWVDVLLNGSAYAPGGKPATRVPVGLRVNGKAKTFAVVGNRHWNSVTGFGITASAPEPFTVMPITYDRAFGGVDNKHDKSGQACGVHPQPRGQGFPQALEKRMGRRCTTAQHGRTHPPRHQYRQRHAPMSFGSIGRGWDPRYRYAGTYDDKWLEEHFPFLPPGFDEKYYQAAWRTRDCIAQPHAGRNEVDALGQVTAAIDVLDKRRSLQWDEAGNLLSETDCSGYSRRDAFDALSHLLSSTDALGQRTDYVFDAAGQLQQEIHPDGARHQYTWDSEGNLIRYVDPLGRTTTWQRNGDGEPILRVDALGNTQRYQYDHAGPMITVTNGVGDVTEFRYDVLNHLTDEMGFDGCHQRYIYDAAGELSHWIKETVADISNGFAYDFD